MGPVLNSLMLRPLASAMPPCGPTLLEAILKSCMLGERARIAAMCCAPALSLMLLNRCSRRSVEQAAVSSSTALQAKMEQPTFCRDSSSRLVCSRAGGAAGSEDCVTG